MNIDDLQDHPHAILWAAGLYEGEGCASLDISGPAISVTIGMTDEEPIRLFHAIVGVGIVKGPFKREGNRKEYWLWRVRSWDQAEIVFDLFRNWLSPRRIQQFEYAFLHRPERPDTAPACGKCDPDTPSTAGYQRHRRKGETVCEAAWIANRKYRRIHG